MDMLFVFYFLSFSVKALILSHSLAAIFCIPLLHGCNSIPKLVHIPNEKFVMSFIIELNKTYGG